MADIIAKLVLQSGEFDSKIKRAVTGLQQMENECRKAGKSMNDMDENNRKFVQSLGSMQTVSTTVRGKIGELSGAFVELRSQYNRLTDEEKKGDFGRALSGSLEQLKTRVAEAKRELSDITKEFNGNGSAQGGDGFLSGISGKMGGMLQVFGGNLMTKGVEMLSGLASEMGDMVNQGVQLAKEGEGIRIAFERLGRGDILDGLRQATHGTVTDLELMKAAVKFNDFKLPVEELGTMLAFAQQKAKDTGQSVDYMVDSIVTGLGRKSLMILDNLGLSSAEIKEKMAETGDMTKAVGEIIREQMQNAGDYVETAADRAAQANVDLQNKMEELGRKFAPLEEASNSLWTSMKIGILNVVSGPLTRLLNGLTEAGRLRNQMNDMAGGNSNSETDKQIKFLRNTSADKRKARYDKQISIYNEQENYAWRQVNALRSQQAAFRREKREKGVSDSDYDKTLEYERGIAEWTRKAKAWQNFRINYQRAAQPLLTPNRPAPSPAQEIPSSGGKTGRGKTSHTTTTPAAELTEEQKIQKQINELVQQGMTMDEQGRSAQREKIAALQTQLEGYKKIKDELLGIEKKEKEVKPEKPTYTQAFSGGAVSLPSIQAYVSGLQSEIANTDIGSDLFNNLTEKMADAGRMSEVLKSAMDSGVQGVDLTSIAQEMKAKLLEGDISDEDWQAFLDKINEKIDNSELKLKIDVDTNGIITSADEQKKLAAQTQKAWNMAAQSVGNLSTALNSIEDPAAKAAGTVIKAIADIALGFAQASVQAGAMGPWGWVAWLAAGTAALATTISTVHSLTGLANGGIVPGNSLSGDNVYGGGAMVNSGELVLTKAQQGNLASQLTHSAVQGFGGQPYVEGEKIFLGMNNSSRRMGRGEIVTTQTLRRMGLIR